MDLFQQRLYNQHVTGDPMERPEEVVAWLGAAQSQDYHGAAWSLGQRMRKGTRAAIDEAYNSGKILRTHAMRPTWHFLSPEDIHWVQELTAPRVHTVNGYMYRQLELDETTFARSHALFVEALQGGNHLTRKELGAVLKRGGIVAEKMRLAYIVMHAELEGLICSGAMRGKQHTYALLAERAPQAIQLGREESLAELTRRFFVSHGPARVKDFTWWSGLTVAEAQAGLEMARNHLASEEIEGQRYYFSASMRQVPHPSNDAFLLPEYDECVIAYKDNVLPDMPYTVDMDSWEDTFYRPIVIEGQRAGTWRRTIERASVLIEAKLFTSLDNTQWQKLEAAAARYGAFMGMPVRVEKYSG